MKVGRGGELGGRPRLAPALLSDPLPQESSHQPLSYHRTFLEVGFESILKHLKVHFNSFN